MNNNTENKEFELTNSNIEFSARDALFDIEDSSYYFYGNGKDYSDISELSNALNNVFIYSCLIKLKLLPLDIDNYADVTKNFTEEQKEFLFSLDGKSRLSSMNGGVCISMKGELDGDKDKFYYDVYCGNSHITVDEFLELLGYFEGGNEVADVVSKLNSQTINEDLDVSFNVVDTGKIQVYDYNFKEKENDYFVRNTTADNILENIVNGEEDSFSLNLEVITSKENLDLFHEVLTDVTGNNFDNYDGLWFDFFKDKSNKFVCSIDRTGVRFYISLDNLEYLISFFDDKNLQEDIKNVVNTLKGLNMNSEQKESLLENEVDAVEFVSNNSGNLFDISSVLYTFYYYKSCDLDSEEKTHSPDLAYQGTHNLSITNPVGCTICIRGKCNDGNLEYLEGESNRCRGWLDYGHHRLDTRGLLPLNVSYDEDEHRFILSESHFSLNEFIYLLSTYFDGSEELIANLRRIYGTGLEEDINNEIEFEATPITHVEGKVSNDYIAFTKEMYERLKGIADGTIKPKRKYYCKRITQELCDNIVKEIPSNYFSSDLSDQTVLYSPDEYYISGSGWHYAGFYGGYKYKINTPKTQGGGGKRLNVYGNRRPFYAPNDCERAVIEGEILEGNLREDIDSEIEFEPVAKPGESDPRANALANYLDGEEIYFSDITPSGYEHEYTVEDFEEKGNAAFLVLTTNEAETKAIDYFYEYLSEVGFATYCNDDVPTAMSGIDDDEFFDFLGDVLDNMDDEELIMEYGEDSFFEDYELKDEVKIQEVLDYYDNIDHDEENTEFTLNGTKYDLDGIGELLNNDEAYEHQYDEYDLENYVCNRYKMMEEIQGRYSSEEIADIFMGGDYFWDWAEDAVNLRYIAEETILNDGDEVGYQLASYDGEGIELDGTYNAYRTE